MHVHLVTAPTMVHLNHGDLGKGIDPPLGILSLAGYVRHYGASPVHITVSDGLVDGYEKTLQRIMNEMPDVLGISAVTPTILGAYTFINAIKKMNPSVRIVLGGPHPSALPEEAFEQSQVDVVVVGEGEETFNELVSCYEAGGWTCDALSRLKGIWYRDKDRLVHTAPRPFIADLDRIPFPARDLIDMSRYTGYPIAMRSPSTSVMSSRGCPFDCLFCSNNVWKTAQPHYRTRSVMNYVDELEELHRQGYREFFDVADEFNTDLNHAKEILKEIIKRGLTIKIKCQLRAAPIDDELVRLMRDAGVWYVHLGIESANEETLRGICKNLPRAQVDACCRLLKRFGIKIWGLFMYFNLWEEHGQVRGEDYQQSMETFAYAKELYRQGRIDFFGGSITTPYPGSRLWDIAVRHHLIKPECQGKWDMWFYKRNSTLVSTFPCCAESDIFRLHQHTVKYTIRSLFRGRLIRWHNLFFLIQRGLYFLKRYMRMTQST